MRWPSVSILGEIKRARSALERDYTTKQRVDEIERSANDLFARLGRPGAEGHGAAGAALERNVLRTVYAGLEDRSSVRRRRPPPGDVDEIAEAIESVPLPSLGQRASPFQTRTERLRQFAWIRERSRTEDDAIAAALGLEVWGLGIQLLFVEAPPQRAG